MNAEEIENARVERVDIGSAHHDFRGFFTVMFAGDSWGQGANPPFTREWIDKFITACGAETLSKCVGRIVRVVRRGGMIVAVRHVLTDDTAVIREEA